MVVEALPTISNIEELAVPPTGLSAQTVSLAYGEDVPIPTLSVTVLRVVSPPAEAKPPAEAALVWVVPSGNMNPPVPE